MKKLIKQIIFILLIASILYTVLLLCRVEVKPAPSQQVGPTRPGTVGAAGGANNTYAVTGPPTISANQADGILCTRSKADTPAISPACGTGGKLHALGVHYNIDPVYALAWFLHESSFGRYGIAKRNMGLGNIRCTDAHLKTPGHFCIDGFRAYRSYQEGYEDWYRLIRYYVDEWGKPTIQDIIPTYAPALENNVAGYIQAVKTSVDTWRAAA